MGPRQRAADNLMNAASRNIYAPSGKADATFSLAPAAGISVPVTGMGTNATPEFFYDRVVKLYATFSPAPATGISVSAPGIRTNATPRDRHPGGKIF
jgi:hypothetical protein